MSAADSSLSSDRQQDTCAPIDCRQSQTPEMQDRRLVDRCLAGEERAWDELYTQHHERLVASIKLMFGQRPWDPNLVEEIAARVWFALVSNGGKLLDRYDATRECRLSTFLMLIAKSQASTIFRSERRRRYREQLASKPESDPTDGLEETAEFAEFLSALRPSERQFLTEVLTRSSEDGASGDSMTDTNRWQLNSRIHAKLRHFFNTT